MGLLQEMGLVFVRDRIQRPLKGMGHGVVMEVRVQTHGLQRGSGREACMLRSFECCKGLAEAVILLHSVYSSKV